MVGGIHLRGTELSLLGFNLREGWVEASEAFTITQDFIVAADRLILK